ncbi:MAG: hypothetical protein IPG76_00785 [Acidobacteria bacterium]|nr:hypothetical protein [Acidobacteriota bacterium]
MGAEFIPAMSDGGGNAVIAEYDVTRLIGGDVETVRARLEEALECNCSHQVQLFDMLILRFRD